MRKHILSAAPESADQPGIDVRSLATVYVTSEDSAHPIDLAFDGHHGPGGTYWLAAQPGPQKIIVAFDTPHTIQKVIVETEEREASRTQEMALAISRDGGSTYRELRRQEFNFNPDSTTWEREEWILAEADVTHVSLSIKPDKGRKDCRASLTTFALS
ncbi:MAG TPA: discoidin domain-containing protein [Nitrospiraceae bacterium]|nr:discoidin domain-containing protein [Nitrospiraceae bacterium]